jgi:hypothetical protein
MAKMLPLRLASSVCCSTTERSLLRRSKVAGPPSLRVVPAEKDPVISVEVARNNSKFSTAAPNAGGAFRDDLGMMMLLLKEGLHTISVGNETMECAAIGSAACTRADRVFRKRLGCSSPFSSELEKQSCR